MSTTHTNLGGCPQCTSPIPTSCAIIAYETSDGQAVYAECPACSSVVHPAE